MVQALPCVHISVGSSVVMQAVLSLHNRYVTDLELVIRYLHSHHCILIIVSLFFC